MRPSRFITAFGHVRYNQIHNRPQAFKLAVVRSGCDIADCSLSRDLTDPIVRCWSPPEGIVFDHCHQHGFVRGLLCNGHNVVLGRLEAVMSMPGVSVTLGPDSPFHSYIANCPVCSDSPVLPAQPPFAELPKPKPGVVLSVERGLIPTLAPRRHKRGAVAHLVGPGRTRCGRNVGRYVLAERGTKVCEVCATGVKVPLESFWDLPEYPAITWPS